MAKYGEEIEVARASGKVHFPDFDLQVGIGERQTSDGACSPIYGFLATNGKEETRFTFLQGKDRKKSEIFGISGKEFRISYEHISLGRITIVKI